MFWLGYCYEKLQQTKDAAILYKRLVGKYSQTPAARQAAERLSRLPTSAKP